MLLLLLYYILVHLVPVVKPSVICVNSCNARNEIWLFSKWLAIYSYLFNQYSTPNLEGTTDHCRQKKFRLRAADFPHFHDENCNARNTNVMHITALFWPSLIFWNDSITYIWINDTEGIFIEPFPFFIRKKSNKNQ